MLWREKRPHFHPDPCHPAPSYCPLLSARQGTRLHACGRPASHPSSICMPCKQLPLAVSSRPSGAHSCITRPGKDRPKGQTCEIWEQAGGHLGRGLQSHRHGECGLEGDEEGLPLGPADCAPHREGSGQSSTPVEHRHPPLPRFTGASPSPAACRPQARDWGCLSIRGLLGRSPNGTFSLLRYLSSWKKCGLTPPCGFLAVGRAGRR